MKTLIFSLFLTILFVSGVLSQDNSVSSLIYEGKLAIEQGNNTFDKQQLLKAHGIFERIYSAQPQNLLALYYLTYSEYRLLMYGLHKPEKPVYDNFIDKAIENAKKLIEIKEYKGEGSVLLAAIYMMKISNSTMEAPILSPRFHGLLDDAQEIDSSNPRSYLVRGIMKYNTPAFFGGSKEDAINNCRQAISLFKKNKYTDSLSIDWGLAESYTWMGIALNETGQTAKAKEAYLKALEASPDYGWVKYNLLPNLEKAQASTK